MGWIVGVGRQGWEAAIGSGGGGGCLLDIDCDLVCDIRGQGREVGNVQEGGLLFLAWGGEWE